MTAKIQKLMVAAISLVMAVQSRVIVRGGGGGGGGWGGRRGRLSLAESPPSYYYTNIDGHPGTYAFGYDIVDPETGHTQFRTEEKYPNGTVVGSYGYMDAYGKPLHYEYIADHNGYRVTQVRMSQPLIADNPYPYTSNYYTASSMDEQPELIITRSGRPSPTSVRARTRLENEMLASNLI